jgi:oxygen-independent coproporphyrinogen-3 oxidase
MNKDYSIEQRTWKKDLRLYVHVPFCAKKCDYCDFLSGPSDEESIKSYFEALYKEIKSYEGRTHDYIVSSIFIGGGTPSCVNSEYIVRLLKELGKVFDFVPDENREITIEVNPGTIDASKLTDYKNVGINRLSFGLQSSHEHELKLLGRIHSYSEFEENYLLAVELGFNNINIDLMSALPGQDLKSWEETLYRIIKLNPKHISAYSLMIEEGTPFYEKYGPDGEYKDNLPSEEIELLIYRRTKEILLQYGYERYEISNYAKKGYECRHNMAYWEGIPYLGFGIGSVSFIENTRFNNTNSLKEYQDAALYCHNNIMSTNMADVDKNVLLYDFYGIRRDMISLTKSQLIEEFMIFGLRKTKGISKSKFFSRVGVAIDEIYGDILFRLKNEGLIIIDKDAVWLTDYGIDVSNRVLSEFLFDKSEIYS